jgi:hypothetical protein
MPTQDMTTSKEDGKILRYMVEEQKMFYGRPW